MYEALSGKVPVGELPSLRVKQLPVFHGEELDAPGDPSRKAFPARTSLSDRTGT